MSAQNTDKGLQKAAEFNKIADRYYTASTTGHVIGGLALGTCVLGYAGTVGLTALPFVMGAILLNYTFLSLKGDEYMGKAYRLTHGQQELDLPTPPQPKN